MNLLVQLSLMGFTNRREILESIRELVSHTNPSQPPSVDSVMVATIAQREEAEEARHMNEASEQARKEDTQRRQSLIHNNVEEKLKTASMDDWRRTSGMFPDSWILKENICYEFLSSLIPDNDTVLKGKLLALLKLEKKAK
jgi:hypothetical protein